MVWILESKQKGDTKKAGVQIKYAVSCLLLHSANYVIMNYSLVSGYRGPFSLSIALPLS